MVEGFRFADRRDAGRMLADHIEARGIGGPETVVLGLPRGGVPVAAEVAKRIGSPLDVIVVRKIGVPWHRELALGALGEGGVRILDHDLVQRVGVTPQQLAEVEQRESGTLEHRVRQLRTRRDRVSLTGRTALIIDDGIATGSTVRAACKVARELGAARVVVAAPVAPRDTAADLGDVADEVICLMSPRVFHGVGAFYDDFTQVDDRKVLELLGED
ncbi:MAG: phosphoribosyltransferase family protein [Acidimicrobiia bacterium]